jgi:transposase
MGERRVASTPKKGALLKVTFCFYDESGYSERPTVRRTWGKVGRTPTIRSTGSWNNISATGIIATDAQMKRVRAFATFTNGSVRKEDTLATLRHLLRHIKGTIALFWDGLAQHRALIVKEFLTLHRKRFVMVERFPAYAPELNPQEYVWASSKTKDMANYCPQETGDLLRRAKKSIRRIQRSPDILHGALRKSGLFRGREISESQ